MNQLLPQAETAHHLHMPRPAEQIHIRMAVSEKEKQLVYRLRYQIYVEEMGKKLATVNHRHRLLYDDMDDWGLLFYAMAGREIVGTLRLHIGRAHDFAPELVEAMAMDKFASFRPRSGSPPPLSFGSKGMIAPHYRNSQVLNMLVTANYETCRQQGVLFNLIGCAPAIVAMHEHIGARRYKSNFFVPDYGYMVPLVILLDDVHHLQQVRSPLGRVADRWPNSPEAAAWFAGEFPQAPARYINKQLTGEAELWRLLCDKLGRRPEAAIDLFRGLSEAEARICANAGHLVFCEQGDTIIYPDDILNAVYVIVAGSLRARSHAPGRRPTASFLGPGQACGEKAYRNRERENATVVARTDAELLVFPRNALARLEAQHPDIAAKLLRNMGARTTKKYA